MSKNDLFLVLGNQLFPIEYLNKTKINKVFMSEDYDLCSFHKHHKLKILMFFLAMREYKDELKNNGYNLFYNSIEDDNFKDSFENKLLKIVNENKISKISYFEIEDKFFEKQISEFILKNKLECEIIPSPMFLCSRKSFIEFTKTQNKKVRMASFYPLMRKKLNVLIDEQNKPIGGKWSFDEDNRKKIPKNITIPDKPKNFVNKNKDDLKSSINKHFNDHPGSMENLWMPTNRKDALVWFEDFLKNKFHNFGNYEDAIISENNFLFHSALSPMMNLGLLTPKEIISRATDFSKEKNIPFNSLEGFIRQIIGWREFIRGVYQNYYDKKENFWNHNNRLTSDWYTGNTGIIPLDDTIKDCLEYGYTHHIPRLMIVANIMNLSRIHPDDIYNWFMEMFVDSSDWVMTPNVYGMGTFSDGGIFATKPYSCGSNYIIKMSNYKKGDWCSILDGLYWMFIEDNIAFFKKNPRLSILTRSIEKMDNDRKKLIFEAAKTFINKKTT